MAGKNVAVAVDEQPPRPRPEQVPAFMWVFDISAEADIKPLSAYSMSESDTPWTRAEHGGRFGAHQCHERMTDSLVHVTWFRGGLRIVDIADPLKPKEVGYYIPPPGKDQKTPQKNRQFVDERGLIALIDRLNGLQQCRIQWAGGSKIRGLGSDDSCKAFPEIIEGAPTTPNSE